MTSKRYPQKFIGHISWADGPDCSTDVPVKRAILKTDRDFALGCEVDGYGYDVRLKSNDGIRFTGSFLGQKGHEKYAVNAAARIYRNPEGIVLVGEWTENHAEYAWWSELKQVEHFPDEQA